jgi:APA family basic amino acid/polyamine antiporter
MMIGENKLGREIKLFPATSIVIANMIGAGIFTTSGLLMQELHNPILMLLLWVAGGIIALCGALSYGELGAALPEAGGEYLFLSRLVHPVFGFLSGWVSFIVGFSAPIAASALGFSEYFSRALPGAMLYSSGGLVSGQLIKKLMAVIVISFFTFVHYRGVRTGVLIQNILTVMKIALIVFLLLAGFLSGNGNMGNLVAREGMEVGFAGWKATGLGLMWIMFAFSGWNASTYLGSEIRDPARVLPRSLLLGTLVVTFLYLGINMLFIYAVEPGAMQGVISIGGLAMGNLFGKSADVISSLLIAFALFSSLSAFLIIGPRVYYSMAKDGLFFRSAAQVHARFGVPSNSILLQGLIAIIMVLSGTFEQVLTYMGFALGIFPILTVMTIPRLRRTFPQARRLTGYPFTQIIYVSSGLLILVLALMQRPAESGTAILTVLAGIPAYYYFKKNLPEKKAQ